MELEKEQLDQINKDATYSKFLTFTIDKSEYAVDIMIVREIRGWTEVTRLPNTPEEMRGVMNLRGIIIPIFDLRTRFKLGVTNPTPKNVVIILAAGDKTIGILVDTVSDILDADNNQIKPAPENDMDIDDKYITGLISVNERMVIILDMEKLFSNTEDIDTSTINKGN